MPNIPSLLKTIILSLLLLLPAALPRQAGAADFSEGAAGLSGYFSGKSLYSYLDFFLPLYEMPDNAVFFINPALGFSKQFVEGGRHEERLSFGLGHRIYLPGEQFGRGAGGFFSKGLILGLNWHIDEMYSRYGNLFTRTGGGAELLSNWFDARFNCYFSLTKAKELDRHPGSRRDFFGSATYNDGAYDYETMYSGMDGELGLRLPLVDQIGEIRLFGGAYYYTAGHVDKVSGLKARLEWNPLPSISLGAAVFSSRHLNGDRWQVQLGYRLPFSMNALWSGDNPFSMDNTPKTGNLWRDRSTYQVRRNGM